MSDAEHDAHRECEEESFRRQRKEGDEKCPHSASIRSASEIGNAAPPSVPTTAPAAATEAENERLSNTLMRVRNILANYAHRDGNTLVDKAICEIDVALAAQDSGSETQQMPMGVASEQTGLLPCPHCGGEAKVEWTDHPYWNRHIVCQRCFVRTDRYNSPTHLEAMMADWNRRVSPVSSVATESVASGEKENQPAPRPMEQQREVLLCPFCGSDYIFLGTVDNTAGNTKYLRCGHCMAQGPWAKYGKEYAAWNSRAASVSSPTTPSTDAGETKTTSPAPATATEEKKNKIAGLLYDLESRGLINLSGSPQRRNAIASELANLFAPQPSATDEQRKE